MTRTGRGDWKILIKTIWTRGLEEDRNRFLFTGRTVVGGGGGGERKERTESLVMALYDFAFYSTDKWGLGFASKSKIRGRGSIPSPSVTADRVNCIILEQNPRILKLLLVIERMRVCGEIENGHDYYDDWIKIFDNQLCRGLLFNFGIIITTVTLR